MPFDKEMFKSTVGMSPGIPLCARPMRRSIPFASEHRTRRIVMTTTWARQSVGSLVRECPARAQIFERFGIDYCCHGNRSLAEACARAEVRLDDICAALNEGDISSGSPHEGDLECATLTALIEDIIQRHHAYLRRRLPELTRMLDRVAAAHGQRHPELYAIREVLASLRDELTTHMMKEERILFPAIVELERAQAESRRCALFGCGSMANPIAVMESEHRSAGDALSLLHRLTNAYDVPNDACETYRALFNGLKELEADLHLHIHKENNILFPKAVELEAAVTSFDEGQLSASP